MVLNLSFHDAQFFAYAESLKKRIFDTIGNGDLEGLKDAVCLWQGQSFQRSLKMFYADEDIDATIIIELMDEYRQTPLHYAVTEERADMCQFLIDKGFSKEVRDVSKMSPMNLVGDDDTDEVLRNCHAPEDPPKLGVI